MASLLDGLAEPFTAVETEAASAALASRWGIEGRDLTRLDTERDDSFRAETADGFVILKIAHPNDPPALIDLQSRAMEHARSADPGIPLQHVLRTRDDALAAEIDGRTARVLTWLDGDVMEDSPRSPALLHDAGRMLGRLNRALADFEHPAADRALSWDLPHLPDLRSHATEPLHLDVIDRFAAEVSPAITGLPQQVVHNDGHPGNLLVDPANPDAVAGILDFGDTVRTARVCDLAVALAYLVPDAPRPWPDVDAFTAGFESVVTLSDEERALLPMLIAARTIMRTVINQALNPGPGNEEFYARNDRKLRHILTLQKEFGT